MEEGRGLSRWHQEPPFMDICFMSGTRLKFSSSSHFIFMITMRFVMLLPHITDEETETQGGLATCQESHSYQAAEPGPTPSQPPGSQCFSGSKQDVFQTSWVFLLPGQRLGGRAEEWKERLSWDGDVSSFSVFFQNLVLKQECLAVKWNGIGGERKRDDNPSPTPTPCPGMTFRVRRVGGSLGPA